MDPAVAGGLRGGLGAYGLYAVCAAISAIFVHRMVRETRGLELEEMKG
jgi:SP family sugar:H+ symporter-like MFS transporter